MNHSREEEGIHDFVWKMTTTGRIALNKGGAVFFVWFGEPRLNSPDRKLFNG